MHVKRALILAVGFIAACGGNSQSDNSPPTGGSGTAGASGSGAGGTGGSGAGGSGGSGTTGSNPGAPDMAGTPAGSLHLTTSATLGSHLVDGNGHSLYLFGKDVPAAPNGTPTTNCAGACISAWPVFHVDTVTVDAGLSASDFGEYLRPDGAKQTTYKGWPLYYFASDAAAGDTQGQGVGGVWFVVTEPFYSVLVRGDATQAHFLVNAAGRSLYYFFKDTRGTATSAPVSACTTAPCSTSWPVFFADPARGPSTLSGGDFSVLTWPDGTTKQTVYRGHPLYYFAGDSAPGQTNGRGVGNAWDTLDPTAN